MTIATLTEKAFAVTGLPEGAQPINIGYNTEGVFLWYKYGHRNYQLRLNVDKPWRTKEVNWRILGRAAELTEEDWKRVVTSPDENGLVDTYKNYVNIENWLTNALESGHSLLKAEGLELLNPLILIK